MVVIIDYNIGNLSSVISALKRVGIEAVITRDKDIIRQAKAIVLPAYSDYGKTNITAIAAKDNVIGCQFHPEKSGAVGQKILLAFKEMIEC